MGVNFNPNMTEYSGIRPFRFWCQKVLPLVYDDSLSYYELLNKVVDYLNNVIEDESAMVENIDSLLTAYEQLQDYVNNYFDNLDVQEEINNKLDNMVSDGTFYNVFHSSVEQSVLDSVYSWLDDNMIPIGSTTILDSSLELPNAAAPAKTVGDLVFPMEYALFDKSDNQWKYWANSSHPTGWRYGYYGTANGDYTTSNNYMCTAQRMKIYNADYIIITPPAGHGVRAYYWNSDLTELINYTPYTEYGEPLILEINPNYGYGFALNGFNHNSSDYVTDEFVSTILMEKHRSLTSHYVPTPNTEFKEPCFVIPSMMYSDVIQRDAYYYEDTIYNKTQGMCGYDRYLYYTLRSSDEDISIVRKYDIINKNIVLTHIPETNYGHCEDMCFMPKEFAGFDNNAVDRILLSDANRVHESGCYWIVLNADTLEYIGEYATNSLISTSVAQYWQGAIRMTSSVRRGKFVLEGGKDVDGVHHRYLAVFDKNGGNPERLIHFIRSGGTQSGISCDENYIYLTRYSSTGVTDVFNVYVYIFDWDLNIIARGNIDQIVWEFEGMCNVGNDIYFSWIRDSSSKGVVISKARVVDAFYPLYSEIPFTSYGGFTDFEKLIGDSTSFKIPQIADVYNSNSAYAVGDYVIYGGTLYKCASAIANGENWNPQHWEVADLTGDFVNLEGEVADLNSAIGDLNNLNTTDKSSIVNAINEVLSSLT